VRRYQRLAHEIMLEGRRTSPTDSPEVAEARRRLAADIDAIKAKGGIVDLPE
jgi:hypothetical protein